MYTRQWEEYCGLQKFTKCFADEYGSCTDYTDSHDNMTDFGLYRATHTIPLI